MLQFFYGYGYHGTSFEQTYLCYPASFIDKPQTENGDKIIMPPSALDRLASLHIDYPMLFELHNAATERMSHCGVLEFIAEEGMIYMPYWMIENLLLQEGDIVRVVRENRSAAPLQKELNNIYIIYEIDRQAFFSPGIHCCRCVLRKK
ncbi:ubiquitin recognition factor in ER-associated degradation protein 1-like [Camellia sinensis]|uniref:ubiquitin recognition factor in ER-associated degradation protein 1-like n=1 Tax=Camellia sinensis TaxID=4442 RepID=UPI001035ED34|nr:ubiquitin recognition factor in ER-associated degradation protein 1-like [Camellia sinensis]